MTTMIRLRADFNGLFGELLCLSHSDTCTDDAGNKVVLQAGMVVTAFEPDFHDGQPADLVATGIVEPSPDWLQCNGSRWALRIDENGVRHVAPERRH
jgi:hypothetical protein